MKSIGIDLGVSFIKIGFLTQDGLLDVKRVSAPIADKDSAWKCELNAEIFVVLIRELIDEYLQKDAAVDGIYFSTQMHGFVLYNEADSESSPFISWKDRRSEKYYIAKESIIDYLKRVTPQDLISKTGMELRSGLPSVNLFVLQQQDKLSSRLCFGTIADYVVARLTGTKISTSLTNSAGSGLFDMHKNTWNYELIEYFGIDVSLPEIKSNRSVVGQYEGVNVYSPIGDQQAALLGIEEVDYKNTAVSNIATGSQVTLVSSKLILSDEFQTRPFIDGTYLLTVPFIPAGRVLNSLVFFLTQVSVDLFGYKVSLDETWEKLIQYTQKIDKLETDLAVNSDFIGSFNRDGGAIFNINECNFNIKDVLLGFFDDIANNHVKFLKLLSQQRSFEKVILTGGVPQKIPLLKHLLEAKIEQTVFCSQIKEDALNGLRCLAFSSIKDW